MKKAFTLAEVIITLGIIGVVAAMTLPILQASVQEKGIAARLRKAYQTVSSAYQYAIVENGATNYWGLNAAGNPDGALSIQDKISYNFNVSKDCRTEGGCWPNNNISFLDGSESGVNLGSDTSYATFKIIDGTLFAFKIIDPDCAFEAASDGALKTVCAEMYIDVNGDRNPNRFGYDIFKFYIVKTGVYPAGLPLDTVTSFDEKCLNKTSGLGCTAWVLGNSNLDYLHCTDIGWDANHSCRNMFNYNYSTGI